jgi:glycosyltransferase involved in cell wall biosynthesis
LLVGKILFEGVNALIKKIPHILQISPNNTSGGANKIAYDLHQSYLSRGYPSYMAVAQNDHKDDHVFLIPNENSASSWIRFWQRIENWLILNHHAVISKIPAALSQMKRSVQAEIGIENFDFPGTYQLFNLPPQPPDIVHAHNLHLDYFDLRALPWLSRKVPLIISMHDAWLLSGHCAHSFYCERWMTGCGHCPDLRVYPSVKRDATAYNWWRKKQIYAKSRLYIATACQWLMNKVERSMLYPGVVETRLIQNGVDLTVFKSQKKNEARTALNIPHDRPVVMLRANSLRKKNYWLDYQVAQAVVEAITAHPSKMPVTIVALGYDKPREHFGASEIRYIPHLKDHRTLSQYYQAANIFIHPARADTFPLTVLEALACGTPVIATQVGGISEQIVDGVTGFLTPAGDSKTMIDRALRLLRDAELCSQMGQNAANDAKKRFNHERCVDDYLDWYQEILVSQERFKSISLS